MIMTSNLIANSASIACSTLKSKSLTVGSTRSFGTGLGGSLSTPSAAVASLKMERNLLERMVQERDEKTSSLQKSVAVQNEHVNKLQAKIEISERREKQIEQRHKLKIENLNHEKGMLKSQLKVMHDEIRRISDDPIRHALAVDGGGHPDDSNSLTAIESEEDKILSQMMPAGNPFGVDKEQGGVKQDKIKLATTAQGVLLQTQLYQAMNSLKQLRQQTAVMKKNYDEIITSLQHDFVIATDAKARVESELLSELSLLEQDKNIMERSLEDQLHQKDARIRRLEKRLRSMDDIDDEDDISTNEHLSFDTIGTDSFDAKSVGDDKKLGMGECELKTPYSMSSQNLYSSSTPQTGAVFREPSDTSKPTQPSSSMSAASLLLQQTQIRANSILQKTSLRSMNSSSSGRGSQFSSSIVEEKEEDDDDDTKSVRSSGSSGSGRERRFSPSIVEEEEEDDDAKSVRSSHSSGSGRERRFSPSIVKEEEGDDDAKSVRSYVTTVSESASVASNLLQGSRARAMMLLAKAAPEPPQEITQILSTDSDDFDLT